MEEEARVILTTALSGPQSTDGTVKHVGLGEQIHASLMGVEFPPEFFEALEEIRHGGEYIDVRPREVNFDE